MAIVNYKTEISVRNAGLESLDGIKGRRLITEYWHADSDTDAIIAVPANPHRICLIVQNHGVADELLVILGEQLRGATLLVDLYPSSFQIDREAPWLGPVRVQGENGAVIAMHAAVTEISIEN